MGEVDEHIQKIKDAIGRMGDGIDRYNDLPIDQARTMLALEYATNPKEFRFICDGGLEK